MVRAVKEVSECNLVCRSDIDLIRPPFRATTDTETVECFIEADTAVNEAGLATTEFDSPRLLHSLVQREGDIGALSVGSASRQPKVLEKARLVFVESKDRGMIHHGVSPVGCDRCGRVKELEVSNYQAA